MLLSYKGLLYSYQELVRLWATGNGDVDILFVFKVAMEDAAVQIF